MAYYVILFFVLVFIKIYVKLFTKWCKSNVCLVGKTVIITGANRGIGYMTALDMAKRGARVILACRNKTKADEACQKIIQDTGNKNVVIRMIDLCSFDSVKQFSKNIISTEERLDILVNNAGLGEVDGNKKTIDGHVLTRQVNYFSSFLLTNLLQELLEKSKNGRIINVSSLWAILACDLKPSTLVSYPAVWDEYKYTKLCNILFTQELGRRLKGTRITTYSLEPGLVDTGLSQGLPQPFRSMVKLLLRLFAKTGEEGAQTTIYCALEKDIEKYSGEHFSNCQRVRPYWTARNPKLAQEIWKKTEEILENNLQKKST